MKKYIINVYYNSISRLRALKDRIDIFRGFFYDYRYYMATNYISTSDSIDKVRAGIMLTMHELEKGMSFKKNPRVFGESKANNVLRLLDRYKRICGRDELYITGLNIIHEYYKDPWSTRDVETRKKILSLITEESMYIIESMTGVKKIKKVEPFAGQMGGVF